MEACDVRLGLGLGIGGDHGFSSPCKRKEKSPVQFHMLFPTHVNYKADQRDDGENKFAGGNKKDGSRKKLRLTKEQSSLLEESFRRHNTLNPVQKKELAERLHLKARQVEVWFQNRRARTKLKQTEVDCEFLKKCCESLNEENRRLKKELQELRLMKLRPLSATKNLPMTTTLAICPSCERIASGSGDGGGKSDSETTFDAVPTAIDAKPKLFGYCTKTTVE